MWKTKRGFLEDLNRHHTASRIFWRRALSRPLSLHHMFRGLITPLCSPLCKHLFFSFFFVVTVKNEDNRRYDQIMICFWTWHLKHSKQLHLTRAEKKKMLDVESDRNPAKAIRQEPEVISNLVSSAIPVYLGSRCDILGRHLQQQGEDSRLHSLFVLLITCRRSHAVCIVINSPGTQARWFIVLRPNNVRKHAVSSLTHHFECKQYQRESAPTASTLCYTTQQQSFNGASIHAWKWDFLVLLRHSIHYMDLKHGNIQSGLKTAAFILNNY